MNKERQSSQKNSRGENGLLNLVLTASKARVVHVILLIAVMQCGVDELTLKIPFFIKQKTKKKTLILTVSITQMLNMPFLLYLSFVSTTLIKLQIKECTNLQRVDEFRENHHHHHPYIYITYKYIKLNPTPSQLFEVTEAQLRVTMHCR